MAPIAAGRETSSKSTSMDSCDERTGWSASSQQLQQAMHARSACELIQGSK